MENDLTKKTQTDVDVKRKAVKLVVSHLRKKLPKEFEVSEDLKQWLLDMDELLNKSEFNVKDCFEMRRNLNGIIEQIMDEEMRFRIRDSWYSLGKALDKKVKQ